MGMRHPKQDRTAADDAPVANVPIELLRKQWQCHTAATNFLDKGVNGVGEEGYQTDALIGHHERQNALPEVRDQPDCHGGRHHERQEQADEQTCFKNGPAGAGPVNPISVRDRPEARTIR